MCLRGSNPDLSRNDRWERGDSISVVSNLPQTGSLERHRILSEFLLPFVYPRRLSLAVGLFLIIKQYFKFAGSSKMDSPILSHDSRHKPGESRTSSRPGRPAVSDSYLLSLVFTCFGNTKWTQQQTMIYWHGNLNILFRSTLSLPNSYLFTSKMQSYKRAIGEVSVTVSNAHHSCMSFCQFSLYIYVGSSGMWFYFHYISSMYFMFWVCTN